MQIDVHIHHEHPYLARIEAKLDQLLAQGKKEMSALSDLQTAVAADATVEGSAITLLNGLKASLDALIANGASASDLQALSDQLDSQTAGLAAAVAANTPASP